jgi:serine/threonine protein kinase
VIGQVLGHYRIVAKIGEGGMGVVYRAYDEVLHRDVAVKVVNKDARLDSPTSQSLLHEARASSSLAHPNICTIHEVGETDGELYIVMELVEGKSLRTMSTDAGLPPESVLRYGVQIASALARAHDRGIVHRDLKTANIVVTSDGLVKVLDFGLAKQVGSGIFEGTTRSFATIQDASSVGGTLPYMAPEILRGDAADYRSDLWAMGVVLYEAASGRLPFEGRTGFEISSAIMREIPNPLGPPVPPGLWAIIQRCLTKEPIQRYQRAGEVQAALEAVQSAAIVSTGPGPDLNAPRTTVLHSVRHAHVRKGDFLLLVGTTKGAFILRSNAQRNRWEVGGPYFHGHSVYSMAYDARGGQHRIWASTASYWGTLLRSSDDFGKSWTNPQQATIRFPSDTEEHLADSARPTRGTQRALLWRRTRRALRNSRRRRNMVVSAWSVRSSASSPLDAGQWRSGFAHHCPRPDRQPAHVCGNLSRRRLQDQRWRTYLDRAKPGHPRYVPARQVSRVRAMRTQNRDASRSSRTHLPAKSLGVVSL